MATVYKVKDGPRGDRTDHGRDMSTQELSSKLVNYFCPYLSEDPPEFNIKYPSEYYRHIVIKVSHASELNKKFPKIGFYVVDKLDASEASFLYEMKRKMVKEEVLLSMLNDELSKYEECNQCSFTSIQLLRELDEDGCNWSSANLRCSGVSAEVCRPFADKIISEIKSEYNVIIES